MELKDIRAILTDYTHSIRDYIAESHNNLAEDEREDSEFVDIYLEYVKDYPEEYPDELLQILREPK